MNQEERVGDWFLTFTGVQFWPLDPRPDEVRIEDIAHALSRICRYGGHCLDWYSVAQHSLMVASIVPPKLALHGLLHDAEEAYTGDLIRPIKRGIREVTSAWDEMAARLTMAINASFGLRALTDGEYADIKSADNHALSTERRDLVRATGPEWRLSRTHLALPGTIEPMERDMAEALFLERFRSLRKVAP